LARAASWWDGNGNGKCFACKTPLVGDAGGRPAGYLFALSSPEASAAACWAWCRTCWQLEPAAFDEHAARALKILLPGGRFLDRWEGLP